MKAAIQVHATPPRATQGTHEDILHSVGDDSAMVCVGTGGLWMRMGALCLSWGDWKCHPRTGTRPPPPQPCPLSLHTTERLAPLAEKPIPERGVSQDVSGRHNNLLFSIPLPRTNGPSGKWGAYCWAVAGWDAEECACGGTERYFADGSGQHFAGLDHC